MGASKVSVGIGKKMDSVKLSILRYIKDLVEPHLFITL
jgi:hypothetical protein